MSDGRSTAQRAVPSPASWDALAPLYDRQRVLERSAIEAAVALAAPRAGDRLLDLGTGTGAVLRAVARAGPRLDEAIGVDSSAAMLAQVPALGPPFAVRQADVTRLPFATERFDVITCVYVLHVLAPEDREGLLAEARRVLAAHGRIVLVTPWARPGTPAGRAWALVDRAAARWPERLGGLHRHDPRPGLTAAGFAVSRARVIRNGYPSLCVLARAAT